MSKLTSMAKARPLTMDDIRIMAPSVVAERPYHEVSDKYTFVPTTQIIEDLDKLGYFPVAVQEQRCINKSYQGYQKHLIRFRARELAETYDLKELLPELWITNAHDARCSFKALGSVMRQVCANGMVAGKSIMPEVRIHHIGYTIDEVNNGVSKIATGLPRVYDRIEHWREKELNPEVRHNFAKDAIDIRWPDKDTAPYVKPTDILSVRRPENFGHSLWHTFNIVQENIVRGGLKTIAQRSRRRTRSREIKAIDSLISINEKLWELAEEYARN